MTFLKRFEKGGAENNWIKKRYIGNPKTLFALLSFASFIWWCEGEPSQTNNEDPKNLPKYPTERTRNSTIYNPNIWWNVWIADGVRGTQRAIMMILEWADGSLVWRVVVFQWDSVVETYNYRPE